MNVALRGFCFCVVWAACAFSETAWAAGASGQASGYGLKADISAASASLVNTSLPNPPASVSSTGSDTQTTVGVNVSGAPLLTSPVLQTAVLQGTASAILNGFSTDSVHASGSTDSSAVNVGLLGAVNVLGLTAGVIQANAQAICTNGSPQLSGNSVITNLAVKVLGTPVALNLNSNPNNTVLNENLNVLGVVSGSIQITSNEQTTDANGLHVNALHIAVNVTLLAIPVNLDVIIGHASALMQSACAPLPTLTLSASPTPFVRENSATYSATVTSNGVTPATGPLTIVDTLPSGLSFLPGTTTGAGWTCSAAGQIVTCTNPASLGAAPATSTVAFGVDVSAATASSVTDNATFAAANVPAPTNCSAIPSQPGCASLTTAVVSGNPNLGVALSANPTAFTQGGMGTYNITVTNSGNATATEPLTVTDILPAGVSYLNSAGSDPAWTCSASGQTVTCTSSNDLPATPGSNTSSIKLNVSIASNAGSPVVDVAGVGSANSPSPNCTLAPLPSGCASLSTVVNSSGPPPAPNLALVKSAVGAFIRGSNAGYAFTLTNNGNASANAPLTIADTLPAGLSYVSGGGGAWSCSASGQAVTCTGSSALPAGQSTSTNITVAVASSAPDPVTNTAVASNPQQPPANCAVPNPPSSCATVTTTVSNPPVVPKPILTLSKVANGTFVRGAIGNYVLTVTNSGNASAQAPLTITDTLPAGLSFSSASGNNWTCAAAAQTVTCTNNNPLPAGGSSQVTISVAIASTAPNSVTNNAVVGNPDQPPPDCTTPAVGCASVNTPVNNPPVVPKPILTLSKVASGTFVRGAIGNYVLTVTNSGNASAQAPLTITDTLPAGLSFSSASGTYWTCGVAAQTVTCTNNNPLPAGASSQVTISVAIASTAPDSVTNNAVVGNPDQPPPDCTTPAIGCASVGTPVSSPPAQLTPHLTLSKAAVGDFVRGSNGQYLLIVSNTGTGPAAPPLTLTDNLPAGTSFSSASGTGWTCSAAGQAVTCTNPSALAAGATSQLLLTVAIAATAPNQVTNSAVVGNPTLPPPDCSSLPDGCAIVTTPVNNTPSPDQPHFKLGMIANGTFVRGQAASYTLTVSNSGAADAIAPLTLVDTLPVGLGMGDGSTAVRLPVHSADAATTDWECNASGRIITCTRASSLAAQGQAVVTLSVIVASDAPDQVVNAAVVSNPQLPAPNCATPADACAQVTTPITGGNNVPPPTSPGPTTTTLAIAPVNGPIALIALVLGLLWLARKRSTATH